MNFFQYRKTALDEHLYKLSAGRSMVEMLGVLAIIGVLSVGAISGYSKAMMKYKLNKQAEQLNTLFSIMGIYKSQWKFSQTTYLKDYYVKIGLIPEEMNKDATSYLYDIFNNKILLRNNGAPTYEQTVMQIYLTNSFADNFAICQNIINIAQSHNDSLYAFMVAYTDNDNMEGESGIIYGNDSCQYNRKCIKDIKLNDINNYCQLCNDKASCRFNFVWPIK